MVSEARFDQLSADVDALSDRVIGVEFALDRPDARMRGGVAAAMAMGGTMVVPDTNVSVSFNLSTFAGEQGFSGTLAARLADRLYVSAGIGGSTASDTTGARVGIAIGF